MKKTIWMIYGLMLAGTCYAAGSLLEEYQKRAAIPGLDIPHGAAINFLNNLSGLPMPVEDIQVFEILDADKGSFLIEDSHGVQCMGNWRALRLTCSNKLGYKKSYGAGKVAAGCPADASTACQEFLRRHEIVLDNPNFQASAFLDDYNLPMLTIVDFELINEEEGTFLVKDRRGLVCQGNWLTMKYTCKNPIGLTIKGGDGD